MVCITIYSSLFDDKHINNNNNMLFKKTIIFNAMLISNYPNNRKIISFL